MLKRQSFVLGIVWLAASSAIALAQPVVVLPGSGSSSTTIPVFSSNPFQSQITITGAAPGTFNIIAKPDGSKYYVISNTGGTGVAVYDNNFANGHTISGAIGLAPNAVGVSPDGRKLLVLAGSVYAFDTGTDALISNGTFQVTGSPTDVAFSVDSSKAFVLSTTGVTAVITPIDLVQNTVGTPLTLPNIGAGIATAPNGLLYVSTPNRLFEINPRTLTVTTGGEIPVNANVGKPVFTPDGKYALAINRTPITGSSLLLFDLANHTLAGAFPNFNVTLDRIVVAGPNQAYAFSSANSTIYDVSVRNGLNVSPSALGSLLAANGVGSFAVSNEIPARTVFITSTATGQTFLYKVDLGSNSIAGQVSVSNTPGQIVAYPASNPTSGATTITAFNAGQLVQPSAIGTLPLVVRVQDSLGRPVFGARVDFTTTATGVVLNPASAFTNSDGYAQTYATAPSAPGVVPISASTPGVSTPAPFTITVPGAGGGGGGPTTVAAINIISGNGQLVPENFLATQPLTVQVTDSSGNPVANSPVTFSITQGPGTILGANSTSVNTDSNGMAASPFLASGLGGGSSFLQTTVNAASAVGSVNFIITTVLLTLPNGNPASAPVAILLAPDFATNPQRLIKGGAGQLIKGAIKAQVVATSGYQVGQLIPNVSITVGPLAGDDITKVPSATCVSPQLSGADGIASCDLLLGNVLGIGAINVNIGGLINSSQVLVQVTVGPPATITKILGDNQSGNSGQTLPQPLRIRVLDSAKNSLNNIPLVWTVASGSAKLSATNNTTDVNGVGSTTVTLGNTPGASTINVTAGTGAGAITATFTVNVNVNIATITVTGNGNNQTAPAGAAFPQILTVLVSDTNGQPLPNIPVTFTVASGSASLGQAGPVTTDASGRASINATAGPTAGPVVITATAGNQTATFSLTVRVPGPGIDATSFSNAASGSSGLTPCGIALVSAPGLVPNVQGTVEANVFFGPPPTSLAGATVTVNGIASPLFWVMSSAIAFQTPCETQAGTANVTVQVAGGNTTVVGISVLAYQPGIFEYVAPNNQKFAILLHADPPGALYANIAGSSVTLTNPAHLGEQIKAFVTGLGSVTIPTATGSAGTGGQTIDVPLTVGINNSGVRIVSTEYLEGAVGVYAITFQVPPDTQTGQRQTFAVVANPAGGGSVFANGSFLPIVP